MFWRISRILNLDICCLIGCHLLLIVGGGDISLIEPSVISMKGAAPQQSPARPLGSWQRVINVTAAE